VLPFTEQQIQADPHYQAMTLREQDERTGKVAAQ
jgi:acyl-homoserine-lactone acylase